MRRGEAIVIGSVAAYIIIRTAICFDRDCKSGGIDSSRQIQIGGSGSARQASLEQLPQ